MRTTCIYDHCFGISSSVVLQIIKDPDIREYGSNFISKRLKATHRNTWEYHLEFRLYIVHVFSLYVKFGFVVIFVLRV